jgi:hypothetical protein
MTLVSGYSGEHPQRHIEAIAVAPYPLAGDIQIGGTWLSDAVYAVTIIDQAYDFATGELLSRFEFEAGGFKASVEVLVFCSRDEPSLVCQQVTVTVDREVDLSLKAIVDGRHVDGRAVRFMRNTPGEEKPACDGAGALPQRGAASCPEDGALSQGNWRPLRPRRRALLAAPGRFRVRKLSMLSAACGCSRLSTGTTKVSMSHIT